MANEPDLKSLRVRLGWSQERMAEELGLDRSSVSRMENGNQVMSGPVRRLVGHLMDAHCEMAEGTPVQNQTGSDRSSYPVDAEVSGIEAAE